MARAGTPKRCGGALNNRVGLPTLPSRARPASGGEEGIAGWRIRSVVLAQAPPPATGFRVALWRGWRCRPRGQSFRMPREERRPAGHRGYPALLNAVSHDPLELESPIRIRHGMVRRRMQQCGARMLARPLNLGQIRGTGPVLGQVQQFA